MAFLFGEKGGIISPFRRICGKLIQGRVEPGLILSLVIHGLIMLIPVSVMVVQRYEEIELYIMSEERSVIQDHRFVERKIIEASKISVAPQKEKLLREEKEWIKEDEVLQNKDEKPNTEKTEIKEPVIIPAEPPSNPLSISVSTNPKEAEKPDLNPIPLQSNLSPKTDMQGAVSFSKETVNPPISQTQEVELGSGEGPKFLRRTLPIYPVMARRMGKEGRVVLRLTIDEKGNLSNVEVIENAGYGFAEAAVEAVRKSSFLPALKDGKPVASRAILPIRFSLRSN
ncbi:MAG: energy transducer TonB [Thermodesulfobacteriota bacterium]|nr:energy transducer TonB [Thermodesulfobacteriota bacterium]